MDTTDRDEIALLRTASDAFAQRIAQIGADQLYLPTTCGDWNVAGLISHVLGGNHMAVRLLDGAHRAEALGYLSGLPLGDDPLATFRANADEQLAAFVEPGALERIVEHPMGDLPGAQVLRFRIGDLTLHTWDLARAIDGDEQLPAELVEEVWSDLAPLAENIAMTGLFGDGPSGAVPEDAPLQLRLLDLTGRRP